MDYWDECISQAFDDAGIVAMKEQIEEVAGCVEVDHENYGMAHGHDCIPNPLEAEVERLRAELEREREKRTCDKCGGKGRIVVRGPYHSSSSSCSWCKGEGRR